MAHFADVRTHSRLSGQVFHVPIGRSMKIGVWGGRQSNGCPVDVVAEDRGVLSVTRQAASGNISNYLLKGRRVGETVLNAVAQDNAIWDTCQVHVHMPRARQLPSWKALYDNYAGDEESSEVFRARIGGEVDNPQLTNTCVLRMSEAFNLAGNAIPRGRAGLYTLKGGDKLNYAVRVAEFRKYMVSAFGQPDIVRKPPKGRPVGVASTEFPGLRGVLCFQVSFSDATGHFTLWDGSRAVHGDYFNRAFQVSLWMAG
jgi:hypothetical protein